MTTRYLQRLLLPVIALRRTRQQQIDASEQVSELLRGDAAVRALRDMGLELPRFRAVQRTITHFRH
ncbi:MAG: hypothetical protein Q8O08_04905 [Methyloversatilis sp.]|uniref:hypothetical protein n=1 Tax=Methyloversatilis sp. TaxID=2569862 RepID=UPI00273636E1|nr:hypothetical protein [Methyloversatilis sp.]MDP2868145.1 hypothetical protein [Methyloversatilis sp.]MDP3287202.1 hypothetical protein [Methyloversatilis sp.]MDP3457365.1 hypothetical protein [Methyloversatilis sp.]MDP3578663.1 hypothetical protein [Methyloversatilis sp.]